MVIVMVMPMPHLYSTLHQLLALIEVVRTLRQRLGAVEGGVVQVGGGVVV